MRGAPGGAPQCVSLQLPLCPLQAHTRLPSVVMVITCPHRGQIDDAIGGDSMHRQTVRVSVSAFGVVPQRLQVPSVFVGYGQFLSSGKKEHPFLGQAYVGFPRRASRVVRGVDPHQWQISSSEIIILSPINRSFGERKSTEFACQQKCHVTSKTPSRYPRRNVVESGGGCIYAKLSLIRAHQHRPLPGKGRICA